MVAWLKPCIGGACQLYRTPRHAAPEESVHEIEMLLPFHSDEAIIPIRCFVRGVPLKAIQELMGHATTVDRLEDPQRHIGGTWILHQCTSWP